MLYRNVKFMRFYVAVVVSRDACFAYGFYVFLCRVGAIN